MQVSASPDGNLTLQMAVGEAEDFQRLTRVAVAALTTLYARADMKEAKDFFVRLNEALELSRRDRR